MDVIRWWMFQSELYFVRSSSGSERRDRVGAGARLTESGQFHQIIWFIGKINWLLEKTLPGSGILPERYSPCVMYLQDLCQYFDWNFLHQNGCIYEHNKVLEKYWKSILILTREGKIWEIRRLISDNSVQDSSKSHQENDKKKINDPNLWSNDIL